MKATALLESQHRKVEAIFKKLEAEKGDATALLTELANDLAGHMEIEQTLFYPAIRKIDPDLVAESYEEHALAELALKRLLATEPGAQAFKARVVALKELIEHHVGEEEDDLFPEVEKAVDSAELEKLGAKMKASFEQAVEEGYEKVLPKGFAKTSADGANHGPAKGTSHRAQS
jgi:iron-sulfur cluster repair protein YtfE (RIC family)